MILVFIIIIFFLSSCETIIYGDYKIIDFKINEIVNSTKNIYIVKKGDNLHLISKKKRIPLKDLIEENNIQTPFKIFPNQKLLIPNPNFHIVRKGETIYSISRIYDVDRFQLSSINRLKSKNLIYEGQEIIIPTLNYNKKNKKDKNITKKQVSQITKKSVKTLDHSNNQFSWPVKGKIIMGFGTTKPGLHNDGINIDSIKGAKVKASKSGKIIYTGNEIPGYGNLVLIKHKNNWITAYAHLDKILLKKGIFVNKGDEIGVVGETGNVRKPQLHFEIRKGKKALNPLNYLI